MRFSCFLADHARGLRTGTAFLLLALVAAGVTFCVGPPSYYNSKYAGPMIAPTPTALPGVFTPDVQTEPHTCGFHAASSLYRAYGMDPIAHNIRFRLGTDMRAHNFDGSALGTLPPDLTRVLSQDGFIPRTLLLPSADDAAELRLHLSTGHPAFALIRVKGLHWILLTALDGDRVFVCDSLREGLPHENFAAFVKQRMLGAILVAPRGTN